MGTQVPPRPHHTTSNGEGGWASLEASRDMETGQVASRTVPVPGPTADPGTQAAMSDLGSPWAMADQGTPWAVSPPPPKKMSWGDRCPGGLGALWKHGRLRALWKRGGLRALWKRGGLGALWKRGGLRALWSAEAWGHSGSAEAWGHSGSAELLFCSKETFLKAANS